MKKVIATINMTLDGIYDHTVGLPDKDIHQHYTELLNRGAAILYGRTTYQLMEFWRTFLESPSEKQSMNDFAKAIDSIPKIIFSNTLKNTDWRSATIANKNIKDTVLTLKKQQEGKDIYIGSRSLILQLIKLDLIDELQICIYPMLEGKGSTLFEGLDHQVIFNLVNTKTFNSGAIILYYQPKKEITKN